MSTHRLTRLDTGDFYRWVNRVGYRNELEFWQSLSGLSRGTIFDHMDSYLTSLGYTGHPDDKVRQFLIDQIAAQSGSLANLGTLFDWANCLWDMDFSSGAVSSTRTLEDDQERTLEDGTTRTTEGE